MPDCRRTPWGNRQFFDENACRSGTPYKPLTCCFPVFGGGAGGSSVGVIEALSHASRPVRRMLGIAVTWENVPTATPPAPEASYRTMRQLRPNEIDELVEAYRAGSTIQALASQLRLHRSTVGQHLRARGIDTQPPGLHPDDVPAACKLYRSGDVLIKEPFREVTTVIFLGGSSSGHECLCVRRRSPGSGPSRAVSGRLAPCRHPIRATARARISQFAEANNTLRWLRFFARPR